MGFFKNMLSGALPMGGRKVSLDSSLGNVLIAGNSKYGEDTVLTSYAIDSVNKGRGVIIFREYAGGISAYPQIASSNRLIYDIDCTDGSVTEQINAFSGMAEKDIAAYIIKLFNAYNEIERSKKMSYQNYITLLLELANRAGKKVRLDNLAEISIEDLDDYNMRYCSGTEQLRNDRFLNSMRTEVRELEAYFADFSFNAAGAVLSGTKGLEQIFRLKPIIEISMDFSAKPEEAKVVMTAVIDAVSRFNGAAASVSNVNVIVNGVPNELLIESGLQKLIKSGKGCNVAYTVQDISNLSEKSNEWIDYADTYFFFRQNSNKNKEFCSEFFGTYEKKKVSTTQSKSSPTFMSMIMGNSMGAQNQKGVNTSYEKERVYLPDVFAALPDNTAIFYDKRTNNHTKLTV